MAVKTIKLAKIDLDPDNCNRHDCQGIQEISNSLRRYGQQKPIVVVKNGKRFTCVAGNGRIEAAKLLGWESMFAIVTELQGDALRAFKIADNQLARVSTWDDEQLAALIRALPADLREFLGFTSRQIDHIVEIQERAEPGPASKIKEIRVDGVGQELKDKWLTKSICDWLGLVSNTLRLLTDAES